METESRGEVTQVLEEVAEGIAGAKERLIQCVYLELHEVARRMMRQERLDHSWGATVLVHEVYLRLFNQAAVLPRLDKIPSKDKRAYFFGAAVCAMRRLLVEHARLPQKQLRDKHVPLDDESQIDKAVETLESTLGVSITALDVALKEFEKIDGRAHEVVMLRIFGSLTVKEVAVQLGVSASLVDKDWKWARTWLYKRLKRKDHAV